MSFIDPSLLYAATRRAGSPAVLPGAPLLERLAAAQEQAQAVLLRYVSNPFDYDEGEASLALDTIRFWANSNSAALTRALSSDVDELPESLQLEVGVGAMRSLVLSTFAHATAGVPIHVSGELMREAVAGQYVDDVKLTVSFVNDDANTRLDAFLSILRMEETGGLAKLFAAQPVNGLGVGPGVILAWLVGAAVVIGVILFMANQSHALELNAKLVERCLTDPNIDKDTRQECLKRLAANMRPQGPEMDFGPLIWVVAIASGIWILSSTGTVDTIKSLWASDKRKFAKNGRRRPRRLAR